MMGVLKSMWHQFWGSYNVILYQGCLDDGMKNKLLQRIEYHHHQLSVVKRAS